MATLPASWCQATKRKASLQNRGRGSAKMQRVMNVKECGIEAIDQIVTKHILDFRDKGGAVPVKDFDVDDFINTVPFFKCLADIRHDKEAPSIPLVSRTYEEKYMRSCQYESEKACVMGVQCECMFIDSKNPFVGVQFQLPGEASNERGMCVICMRKTTQLLFYNVVKSGRSVNAIIQKHGNICDMENEYHRNAMLICPPTGPVRNMPLPIVAHQRNRYSVVDINGVKHLKQHGVYQEDF